jgi:hypothetical protein
LGRQLLVSFGVSAEAALNYEMALLACSDEHRRVCRGRDAVQLTIENLRLEAALAATTAATATTAAAATMSSEDTTAAAATTAAAKAALKRIFSGCCPQTSSGWDVIHYGLRHGATGAAAFVMFDLVEVCCHCFLATLLPQHADYCFNQAMQMANVYDEARHNPNNAARMLLTNPVDVVQQFFGPLGFDAEEEAPIVDLLSCNDLHYVDDYDGLEMMLPGERIPDAILLFLKAANKKAYALRAKAHKERAALLNTILEKQTNRSVACIYKV